MTTPMPNEPVTTHDGYQCARAWVALGAIYRQVHDCLVDALDRACGLSVNEFDALVYLQLAEPKPVRQSDLHDAVALSQPALSRMVSRLEQRGLLERSEAEDDKRSVLVALTDRGRETVAAAIPVHAETINRLFVSRLTTTEQAALLNAFSRLDEGETAVSR
jgi:DNA-binding MarR family transcriptional regulator